MASTSCGYVIRKTGAFISKKFPPHIYCIYLCFLITFFLLSHEADGKLSGGRGGGFACNDGMYSGFLHVPTKHLSSEVTEKTK